MYRAYCKFRRHSPRGKDQARRREGVHHGLLALSFALLTSAALGLTLTPAPAQAFCGFYVAGADAKLFANATMVVLMRDGKRTVLSMQNDYQGPPEAFAMVVPVPVVLQEGDVKILRKDLFDRVDTLAAPRLVEYWEEDPCAELGVIGMGNTGLIGTGGGGGSGSGYGNTSVPMVTVEAEFAVGEYDIAILSATESNGLDTWLRANGYNIPAGAEPLLRPYVEQGSKFFVAKVDPSKVEFDGDGKLLLSPLRFHYDSDEFALPVRLGLINAPSPEGGKQDLIVHVLAPGTRYQLANYPNVTIPTNLDLQAGSAEQFGEFYASLFEHTLAAAPGAVVTEYAWSATGCDPCPRPDAALSAQDLLELGVDVLPDRVPTAPVAHSGGGTVDVGSAQAFGRLEKSVVRRVVRAHVSELEACYDARLRTKPALSGRFAVDFAITPAGKVTKVSVSGSTLDDPTLERCVSKAFKGWTFPEPSEQTTVIAGQVLSFRAPGRGSMAMRTIRGSFVLTRLHARYDASSLGEDLVFEAAPAIVGGREIWVDGELEHGATSASGSDSSFQARYAIRHPWTGEVACKQPVRGRWGRQPLGGSATSPTVARQRSGAKAGGSLASFMTAASSEQLGVAAQVGPAPAPESTPVEPEPSAAEPSKPAGACQCSTTRERQPLSGLAFGLATLALLGLERRRRLARGRG